MVGSFLLGALVVWTLVRTGQRRRLAHARRRGQRAETLGFRLLARHGYRVLRREVRSYSTLEVDGRRVKFPVRADGIARRRWRRYVVEIKSGASATLRHRETRRQCIEYALSYRCHGVLLVDPEAGRIWVIKI